VAKEEALSSRQAEEPDFAVVRIFYATDRKVSGKPDPAAYYAGTRGNGDLDLGICDVSLPRDHRMAKLEAPSIWNFEFRDTPGKHMVLLKVQPQPVEAFFTELSGRVQSSQRKEAFVFVHGYNESFEKAARRTAQLAYDLGFEGAPILYSWPSRGSWVDYPADEATIEWTIPHLKEFLTTVAIKSQAQRVHLIAHSMGNRALAAALKEIADNQQGPRSVPLFKEIVLAAPDIDAEVFTQLAQDIQKAGERITLYASSKDEALVASQKFHGGFPRAGESGRAIVAVSGMDTIDASAVDTGLLGHSYYLGKQSILSDLFNLLRDGNPPEARVGLKPVEESGKRYWIFKP
jgi:esterase/lipase superfamily enzyme